jgi:hypothetical protein
MCEAEWAIIVDAEDNSTPDTSTTFGIGLFAFRALMGGHLSPYAREGINA